MPLIMRKETPTVRSLVKKKLPIYIGEKIVKDGIRIAIVNLMPNKEETEKQILKQLVHSPLMVEICFVRMKSYEAQNTDSNYLNQYYQTFEEIQDERIDGMIITGAPLEHVEFEEIKYWEELKKIMDYAKEKITSTLFICWAALAGLYYYYNIPKKIGKQKIFGVFPHSLTSKSKLFAKFKDCFWVPHSRYFQLDRSSLEEIEILEILSESNESGIYVVASKDGRQVFTTGHLEYDQVTLKKEFERDLHRGVPIEIPKNYFPQNNPQCTPIAYWEREARQFYTNWLKDYAKK